ncbi:unnamed protein product [Dibothriocephalus latus]|uniref:RH1 domain-containing protein n=1 Tax=Dibothriocephalus latus TaxID=60516 RepID=A0A3P7NT34_DIBLA|nr:unnamed protein product [Dibothriocephalus latus]
MSDNLFLSGVHKIASRMTDSFGNVQEDVEGTHFTNDGDVKMHQIAMDIYNEFESILNAYGEKPLSTLVPLVANLLEMLNEFGLQKDKMAKELDMLKDHNTILLSKYETAKVDAKVMEEHLYTLEDELHETKKNMETLKQANASSQRLLELKLKNSIDQSSRKKIMQNICETTPELTLDLDGSPFSKLGDEKFDEASISEKSEGLDADDVSREVSKLVKENNELEETKFVFLLPRLFPLLKLCIQER